MPPTPINQVESLKADDASIHLPHHYELESKFVFLETHKSFVENYLENLLGHDEYYFTKNHTVHFDTLNLAALSEKLDSDSVKNKIRLRWYSDPKTNLDSSTIHFEVKNKINYYREKVRFPVALDPRTISSELKIGIFNSVSPNSIPLSLRASSETRYPVIYSTYSRKRYISKTGDWRINFDSDLTFVSANCKCFPDYVHSTIDTRRPIVIEIKGKSNRLPRELTALLANHQRSSFSKYLYFSEQVMKNHQSEASNNGLI